jgi:hypothetical protein
MDRHRTRFLASLAARLEQDRAMRDSQGEEPPIWHRPADQSDPALKPVPSETPRRPFADTARPDDRTRPARAVVEPQSPGQRGLKNKAVENSDARQPSIAAVPWSETGMPKALRDAIASVRRVSSQEMDERPPPRGRVRYEPPFDDDPAEERASWGHAAADEPPFEQHVLDEEVPFDAGMAAERFGEQGLYEEPPLSGYGVAAQEGSNCDAESDARHGFDQDWDDGRASVDEPAWREEPPFDRAAAPPFDDDAADEPPFDKVVHPHWAQGLRGTVPHAPLWRGVAQRRRLNVAALAIATVLVVLAALGLGLLSGAQEIDRWVANLGLTPLADAMVDDMRTEPAPSSTTPSEGGITPSTETESAPQLSKLETVRVAPLAAPPNAEQAPETPANDMPLPPPPKPVFRSSSSAQVPPSSDRIAGPIDNAIEDAAVALLETGGEGGPFEPILVKPASSGPRVLVLYAESAPGSPATALHLVRQLKAAGFAVEGQAVEFPISKPSIRYFFDSDRDEAEAVSAQLDGQIPGGAEVPILDLTHYQPKPREGHVEVWLGG